MPINVRLDRIFPGMGQSLRNDAANLLTGVALTTAASPQTTNIPGVAGLAFTAGRIRLKLYNGGTGATFTDLVVKATDGTNTAWVGGGILHPTVAVPLTTNWLEFEFEFILDVASSGAGGFASGQFSSVIGGANQMQIITTIAGAGGTANMDAELFPLI